MTLVDRLLTVASTYAEARGLSMSRVSTLIFGDGKVLDRLAKGRDVTTGRFEGAMQWLSDNWPVGAHWPEGVDRPPPIKSEVGPQPKPEGTSQ